MEREKRVKLVKILGLLSSPSDGEALSAARRACALLKTENMTWEALIIEDRGSLRNNPGAGSGQAAQGFDWVRMLREIEKSGLAGEWGERVSELLSLYQRGGRLSDAHMRFVLHLFGAINKKR